MIINHIVYTHLTMNVYTNDFLIKLKRKNYLTPTHYIDYISTFLNLVKEKTDITTQQVIII